MHVIEHEAPIHDSDTDIPGSSDPRLAPLLQQLVERGVMDAQGIVIAPCTFRRGMHGKNWIWRVEWSSPPSPPTP